MKNRAEILIQDWVNGDYEGMRGGKVVLFQGRKLSHCKKLRAWIRWDKYLIRYYDLLWFSGFDGAEFILPPIDELKSILEKYIKDYSIEKLSKDAENYTRDFRHRWFYAKTHDISKAEVDSISDKIIYEYFN